MIEILPQLLVNALIAGSIYALASSGLSLAYGLLRILNFSHGHVLMLGAYVFYWATVDLQFNIGLAALICFLFSLFFSKVILKIFIDPFTNYSTMLPFVSTLALSSIIEASVSMIFGVNVKSFEINQFSQSINLGSVYITSIQAFIILSSFILLTLLALIIHNTSLGRQIRAIAQNSYAAESIAISKQKIFSFIFSLSTLFAIYAGVLIGYETNLQPTMGSVYTIKAFAAMILGGMGNLWGTVAASYVIALAENLAVGLDFGPYSIPSGYKDAFAFVVILLVLMFKPTGLFGVKQRAA